MSERAASAMCGYRAFPAWHGRSEQRCRAWAPRCGAAVCGFWARRRFGRGWAGGTSRGSRPGTLPLPAVDRWRCRRGHGRPPRRVPRSRRAVRGFPPLPGPANYYFLSLSFFNFSFVVFCFFIFFLIVIF